MVLNFRSERERASQLAARIDGFVIPLRHVSMLREAEGFSIDRQQEAEDVQREGSVRWVGMSRLGHNSPHGSSEGREGGAGPSRYGPAPPQGTDERPHMWSLTVFCGYLKSHGAGVGNAWVRRGRLLGSSVVRGCGCGLGGSWGCCLKLRQVPGSIALLGHIESRLLELSDLEFKRLDRVLSGGLLGLKRSGEFEVDSSWLERVSRRWMRSSGILDHGFDW